MVHNGYWVDLHVSKVLYTQNDRKLFDNLINSFTVTNDYKYIPLYDINYGNLFYNSAKYDKAAIFYQKALMKHEQSFTKELTKDQWRVLNDQLVMSYGMSGNLENAKMILEYAIKEDSEYPLFYYNLVCVYAEEDNLDKTLEALATAIKYKDNVISGEQFPDPMQDPSFNRYKSESRFMKLVSQLGN